MSVAVEILPSALMTLVECRDGTCSGPVSVPPESGNALAIPAVTVSYHRLIAPIIMRPQSLTPDGCMPSGQPSGGVKLLPASVFDQLDTSLIAVPTSSRRAGRLP